MLGEIALRIPAMAAAERLYIEARRQMVLSQLRPNKIIDERVLDAMQSTPREQFVPKAFRGVAYLDEDISVAPGRSLMEPLVLARLLQEAELAPSDVALAIGSGAGYDLAVMSRLCSTAIGLESDPALAAHSSSLLASLGIDNAPVVEGPLAAGLPKQGPFNVILLCGSVAEVPEALKQQVADGGRMVGVLRPTGAPVGQAFLLKRIGAAFSQRAIFDAGTGRLPGFEPPAGFVF